MGRMQGALQGLAGTAYSSLDAGHEADLEALWTLLQPGVRREGGRYSKAWQAIGFQGSDPQTDFRSMGVLGLQCLLAFARHQPSLATLLVSPDRHYSYPFAIGGISLTKNLLDLCRNGSLDAYFYKHGASVEQFFELYSVATVHFAKFYEMEKPPNILQFETIMKKFVVQFPTMVQ